MSFKKSGVEMTGQVAGKVALVTGGASGIGAAVAELLAREGASVAVTDIDELQGPEIVAGIRKAGGEAIFLKQDVTSEARWIEVVAEVEKRYGRLDILVSNAGIGIAVPSITDMTLEDWRRQNAINLDGVFPFGQTLPATDAQDPRRLDHHDVVAGGPAWCARSVRL
jgi:NAD(P)-dependent dehydrogenase (short-subunit alcohol dehydrogenase family)